MLWPDAPSRRIAKLFRDDPSGWTCNGYRASHKKTGLEIWIANSSFGIEMIAPFSRYGFFFPVGTASQILIWAAYKKWSRDRIMALLDT